MKEQTIYAFWTYDLCPYFLGGEVIEFNDDGSVKVKGYYPHIFGFKPVAIIPGEKGKKVNDELNLMMNEYRREESELKTKYYNKAKELLGLK